MANHNDFKDPTTGKVDWDAYDLAQKREQIAELVALGFREDLTDDQLYVIRKPLDAPEDYHCDGEISPLEAKRYWIQQLNECGLSPREAQLARQFIGV